MKWNRVGYIIYVMDIGSCAQMIKLYNVGGWNLEG